MIACLVSFGWFFWDPDRVLFTVPIIGRPIMWYGAFFVLGFILAYILIVPMVKNVLLQTKKITQRDISNWQILCNELKLGSKAPDTLSYKIFQKLNRQNRDEIIALEQKNVISKNLQNSLLEALNELPVNRLDLEKNFPKGMNSAKDLSLFFIDRLTWYIVFGTIIGARLGHVFFYDWPLYRDNLWKIPMVWEGGLASHGGTLGVLLAVYFFNKRYRKSYPEFTLIKLLDILAAPVALAAMFIRIGNFFNQEILGLQSNVPWAIIFGHPADGSLPVPRHPAQLYEALSLLIIFASLYFLWRWKSNELRPGIIIGLFFIFSFGSRFFIEFWKEHQSMMIDETFLQTGQLLSIPLVLLGFFLLLFGKKLSDFEKKSLSHLPN
jgi:phosphatidylglycerol---prolipoprotein diacylglyceryl transferase